MPSPGSAYSVVWGAVALVANTAKTVAGIKAGANKTVVITEIVVDCDATSGNLLVELVYGDDTSNAPGTNSTSQTPPTVRGTSAVEATAATAWSSEPTVLTVVKKLGRIALPSGPLIVQYPLGREPTGVKTASTLGTFIGIRCTSTVTVTNCDGSIEFEEV